MIDLPITFEQAESLEAFVSLHMYNCYAELNEIEDIPDDWSSYDPYCGCETCESREMLMATFDWLRQNGIVDIYVKHNILPDVKPPF